MKVSKINDLGFDIIGRLEVIKRQIMDEMIGKEVKVTVDRPLGTLHPQFSNIYYTLNYGYIDGIIAGDGEYQDAYILGVFEPVDYFVGNVIAIIYRKNDIENKLVVAPNGMNYSKDEIKDLVSFQEKFFFFFLIMY